MPDGDDGGGEFPKSDVMDSRMNLLVTGGAGFIGSNFIERALKEDGVGRLVNLDCLTYAGDLGRLAAVEGDARYVFERVDLRDAEEVRRVVKEHGITHVVHFAAETHVDRSIAGPGVFVETNVLGAFNLLESCRAVWAEGEAEGCRFLHVSTDEVYGSLGADEAPFTEESPVRPNSPYAASKAAADCLVRSYVKTYDFPAMITRCGNNYGPGQHAEKLIPMVIDKLRRKERIPLYGDGLNVRDWIHVQDHCEALWRVLAVGRVGEVYNVGGGTELTNKKVVEMICDQMDGLTGSGEIASKGLIEFVRDRPGHDRRYALDAGKLMRQLGWRAEVGFESGIRQTLTELLRNL